MMDVNGMAKVSIVSHFCIQLLCDVYADGRFPFLPSTMNQFRRRPAGPLPRILHLLPSGPNSAALKRLLEEPIPEVCFQASRRFAQAPPGHGALIGSAWAVSAN